MADVAAAVIAAAAVVGVQIAAAQRRHQRPEAVHRRQLRALDRARQRARTTQPR